MNQSQEQELKSILVIFDEMLDSGELTEAEEVQIFTARQTIFYSVSDEKISSRLQKILRREK